MAKVLLNLPDGLLKRLDDYCEANSYQRSELIRHIIRMKMDFVKERGYLKNTPGTPGSKSSHSLKGV